MIPVLLLEIVAASAGVYYLRKRRGDRAEKLLVAFLWYTVFNEILSSYAGIAYFSNYEIFGFIEHTVFRNNYWLGNCQLLAGNIVYVYFFSSKLNKIQAKKVLNVLTILMVMAVLVDFTMSNFFDAFSKVSTIFGSLLILLAILLYYLDLLASEKLLNLSYNLAFYISVVLLIHTLCTSPLDFLSNYFKTSTGNELFVSFRVYTLFFLNILLYLTYTIAFILCSKKRHLSY
ncbi:hypothetical protein G5B37_01165 [Rasiella rasia]|uniref:Uncharacterized protein n=1 Tax=Rasiella rasia TaxID=2744027 RepID=A0A6G6GII0_9FLAO|nr:hypothetical protein [Rasiella rasia]QIE58223.1 hypothetical protein G5B37_01165 [Rasiella rasia]